MASTNTAARSRSLQTPIGLVQRFVALIPGLLLLGAVGYAGKFIEQFSTSIPKPITSLFPTLNTVLWAIVIGLIIANTVGHPAHLPARRGHL